MAATAAMSDALHKYTEQDGMPWPKTRETHYQTQLRLRDKGHVIKELFDCWVLYLTLKCHGQQPRLYDVIDRYDSQNKII